MKQKSLSNAKAVDMMEGIVRKTLTYNDDAMLCHIEMKQGAKIPLHHHEPVQIGICLSGKVRFIGETPEDEFIADGGRRLCDGLEQASRRRGVGRLSRRRGVHAFAAGVCGLLGGAQAGRLPVRRWVAGELIDAARPVSEGFRHRGAILCSCLP